LNPNVARKAGVVLLGLLLASLGVHNAVQKATWRTADDGVFWVQQGASDTVVASRVSATGPAARAGVRPGDVLLGIDGQDVLTPAEIERRLAEHAPGDRLRYSLLRAREKRALEVTVEPIRQGNVMLFYYLSLVGFFSLIIGTSVMLRRPANRGVLHFYAICVLFFLRYSMSYTGRFDTADWVFFWADTLATLFVPAVFLHFCLSFPERRLARARPWIVPLAYLPAFALAGAGLASQLLFVAMPARSVLWQTAQVIDAARPLYFAGAFGVSFAVLLYAYRGTQSATSRKQMKWLVWGTGAGTAPFLFFYALPFAFGSTPSATFEVLGALPLALVPLTLAYAVAKHRLRDVELIFRRSLAYTLATASTVGVCLAFIALFGRINPAGEDVHSAIIAVLCTLVVILLFSPVKSRIQEAVDRLFYGDGVRSRGALLRLSQELNAETDLSRVSERLIEGVSDGLGVRAIAILLPDADGALAVFRSRGCREQTQLAHLPAETAPAFRVAPAGTPRTQDELPRIVSETLPELTYFFPCTVRDEVIAVLGVGRRDEFDADPLNSEEIDLLRALAGQAATAFMNGRLYRRLQEKADELERLKDYNESILESIDSGIVVIDLDGRVEHWNRAMELLYGSERAAVLGHELAEVLPPPFTQALHSSLVFGREEEIAHLYKLSLPTPDGRSLRVNVSVAPFLDSPGHRCGSILIVEDVTARVRLEEQLQHSEKMASIGLLAAGVAHEVNTPLAGISSYTQLALGQLSDGPAVKLLEKIEKQSFRAAKIVNNLLNFSRSSGIEVASLDVNKLLLDVLSLLEHQFEGSRVQIRRELAADLPHIRGDENRLQQVFFNLMLNARDAMPRGGWLTLATKFEDDAAIVEIRDTGSGIKPDDIRRIYDPFFTTKGIGRGTGLGLSVSYGIVQEHDGRISVESAPGKGTTFRIALPFESIVEQVVER
jgi:PAS domain S-box-containing protein